MDRPIQKSRWPVKKLLLWGATAAGALLFAYLLFSGSKVKTLVIDSSRVSLGEVRLGAFRETVPVTGNVEPLHSIFITAAEGGNVEEIFTEDGSLVKKGQPLLRLSNSALMLDFMNRETQVIEQINNLRNTRLTLEQNKRSLNDQLIDLDYRLAEALRQYRLDSSLYMSGAISTAEHEQSLNNLTYLKRKRNFTKLNIEREEDIQNSQIRRIDASIGLMERNLEAIRRNLENLTIKSPANGQLTGFNHYLGETKQRGETLGQVAELNGFLVRCRIDEFYLSRVSPGQEGSFTLAGVEHLVRTVKVLPEVVNGQFTADMEFTGRQPEGITRGQTLQIKLALSATTEALLVPRGGFFQSTGGNWVFVLGPDGVARRREVRIGRQNTEHFEVLNGLEPGEQVVVNSYSGYGDAEELVVR